MSALRLGFGTALLWAAGAGAATQPPAYVLMTDAGAVARVITTGADCPRLTIDKRRPLAMTRRAAAAAPGGPRPAAFPVNVCEAQVPPATRRLMLGARRLPLPVRNVRRIVVIGDTGCRLKASDVPGGAGAFQACNDPAAFGFGRVAARAARWRPDLVIHVGDYHYRESPCPAGNAGCSGSPSGYGWDAWNADFFVPAAPLLAAAPFAAARGNHESCARAGQGWWRFLAGRQAPEQDCSDPARDRAGDATPPFAVPLGQGAQLVLLDTGIVGNAPLSPGDWRIDYLMTSYRRLAELAAQARSTIVVDHHPILGFAAVTHDGATELRPAGAALQSVFGGFGLRQLPPRVDVVLSGHVHMWQQLDFASDHPSQFIAGFSGTAEDIVPIPPALALANSPAPGAAVARFASWTGGFGYMTMTRKGPKVWQVTVRDTGGARIERCRVEGRRSQCRPG